MLYEVPYNFDERIITFYRKNISYINYLYLPPFKDDSDNARTNVQSKKIGHCYMPQTRAEYERHLQRITDAGLRFVVLWQIRDKEISKDILDYYCHNHASGFIVASDANAQIIKEYNNKLLVICSIVQKICSDVIKRDLSIYDYVILYYPFNRGLDALQQIRHLKDKLILMPNTLCHVDCPSVHHWFGSNGVDVCCPINIDYIGKCGLILPHDITLFDKFVAGYKIQGREYSTEVIKYLCHFYFHRTKYSDFIDPFVGPELARRIKEVTNNTPPEQYYNTESSNLLSKMGV